MSFEPQRDTESSDSGAPDRLIAAQLVLSIIVPVFNEEETLPELFNRLDAVLEELACQVEVILVDNRSTDSTRKLARQKVTQDPRYCYIRFSRNFGPTVEASISAAYQACSGDAALVLYSDLQDPPELIPQFVELWLQGHDVVYGVQRSRKGEALWRRAGAKFFYRMISRLSDVYIPSDTGDFRLISRRVIDILLTFNERARYTRGLVAWIGFEQIGVPYDRQPRYGGRSKAGLFTIARTAINGITSFSHTPLQILTALGVAICSLCTVMIAVQVLLWTLAESVPGITTIVILVLLGIGINTLALGIIGEYLSRLQIDVKQRPLYIIDETHGIDQPASPVPGTDSDRH